MYKNYGETQVFEGFGVRLGPSWGRLGAIHLGAVLGGLGAVLGLS